MFDVTLRPHKDALFEPVASMLARVCRPEWLTAIGGCCSLLAAGLAAQSLSVLAVILWLVGRVFDGLDGPVARLRGTASDFGGHIDLIADTIGYAAVPIGVAFAVDTRTVWIMTAVLLASFYLNTVSWAHLAAIFEKRGEGATAQGHTTSVVMPPALIEGTETIVFFTAFLALPDQARWIFPLMAVLVIVGVVQRLVSARAQL